MNPRPFLATALLAAALAPAHAVDGVILIDQARALAGNVTPGDAPGFPVTLSQPGSYRLSGNLVVGHPGSHGILITHPGVTLDLNGFELRGPNVCTGVAVAMTCSADSLDQNARGTGIVVQPPSGGPSLVSIENGTVAGFAANGLRGLDGGSRGYSIHRLRVVHSGYSGVISPAAVTDSVITRNRTQGIFDALLVMRTMATYNGGSGIYRGAVRDNYVAGNGSANMDTAPLADQ